ncbi:arsenate reductase (glutaredoxin) [Marinicella rhabdoformis]|uniref:arsenate reductase (glutaredoxin) n=1 Tax=Marinicella rhabdoformis TaxID=2580566 RepID=UPI0012AECF5A|nr:arsenate reductase (glutaredoxin) [Marinicella rhabdoformis]
MSEIVIYHNPRCSKSRATLAILEEQGLKPTIIKYLEDAPSIDDIKLVLKALDMGPRQLMRKGEAEYKDNNFSNEALTDDELIAMMHQFPKVIERPIVLANGQARIGRPPESVLEILS